MAYTFQSRATADLIMLKVTAEKILKLLEKTPGQPGILTLEQIPPALATLEQAVKEEDALRQQLQADLQQAGDEESAHAAALSAQLGAVSLRQQVAPLADMLRRSLEEQKPVTWKL